MKKKEEAIKLSIAIREIKNTAQNYEKEFEEKLIQIKKIFFTLEKFTSSLESLSDKTKVEDDSFNILDINILNINEERKQIMDILRILSQKIFFLKQEMEKIHDKIIYYILFDKFDKIVELSKRDHSSANVSKDKSLSVNCESFLEGCESGSVYFESMYDFDDYSQNLKSNSFQDFQNALPNYSEKSFKQNSSSCSNILSSSGEREIVDLIPREKCSSHKDRDAVWACKGHRHKKFCEICFEKIGFKTHGKLIKISELINTNIDQSKEIKNFLACFKKVMQSIAEKCNALINVKIIPDLPLLESVNFSQLDNQLRFIAKVFKEYEKLKIYEGEMKIDNMQILDILKRLSLSKNIIFQSAKFDINIFSEIKKHSKFFIKIFAHRNLINEKELIQRISSTLQNKYHKKFTITEGNAFIEVNDFIDSKNHKNIYEVKETEILKIVNILNEMHNLKNFLNKEWKIDENKFETKYDNHIFCSNEIAMIGGKIFYNSVGWFGIGIKQKKNYDYDDCPIAYITFNKKLTNEQIRKILYLIIEKENIDILVYKKEKELNWNKIGSGIYLFQNISKAEKKTGEFDLNGKKYKILLMAKVQEDKIKEPINNKSGYWVVEKDFVKIYRILFK